MLTVHSRFSASSGDLVRSFPIRFLIVSMDIKYLLKESRDRRPCGVLEQTYLFFLGSPRIHTAIQGLSRWFIPYNSILLAIYSRFLHLFFSRFMHICIIHMCTLDLENAHYQGTQCTINLYQTPPSVAAIAFHLPRNGPNVSYNASLQRHTTHIRTNIR